MGPGRNVRQFVREVEKLGVGYRSQRFIPSKRRAGCPLFSVTYIDNPARSRHGGPSPRPPACLVAQYLDGEARTHKDEATRAGLLGPGSPVKPALQPPLSLFLSLSFTFYLLSVFSLCFRSHVRARVCIVVQRSPPPRPGPRPRG